MMAEQQKAKHDGGRGGKTLAGRGRLRSVGIYVLIMSVAALVVVLVVSSMQAVVPNSSPRARPITSFGTLVVLMALVGWGITALILFATRQRREFDRRRAHGLCMRCGYDRSSLAKVAACPECGDVPGG